MRRNIGGKRHARKFNQARKRARAVNSPQKIMRGGFRL